MQEMNAVAPVALTEVAMVAGEASGDLLGASLLAAMRQRWPGLQASGIGGPRMVAEGFQARWPSEKLSVFGYIDALKVYRELSSIRNGLAQQWASQTPALFIGVDAPDFNFGLERRLHDAGVKTLHVVCPSFWAWRPHRVKTLKACADHVLCLFPFEPALLAPHGIEATFVGHPLASEIPLQPDRTGARRRLGYADNEVVVAVMPGSRRSEIQHIAPAFLEAVKLLLKQRPQLRMALPTVPSRHAQVQALVQSAGLSGKIEVVQSDSHTVLAAADVALMASGTATLEAALFKCPMVIAYKLGRLSWWTLQHLHLQPWVGLPNILAQDFIVPELLQDAAQPQALARQTLAWLDHPERIEAVKRKFMDIHLSLKQDTAARAVQVIQELIHAPH
jgi:lipid-A-disaccharide synthase